MFVFSGPLVSTTGISATAFITSSKAKRNWPDILLLQIGAGLHQSIGSDHEKALGFRNGILQKYYKNYIGRDANFVTVMLGKSKSRGRLELESSDPFKPALLDPKYLTDPQDLQVLVEGVKFIVKLFEETKTYNKLGAFLSKTPFPGCENHEFRSEAYWECYVRFNLFSLHHQCGTCKMGSVVDSKLR